ncbi:MAG: sensor histidine kinase [Actinomycetota bacterium]|nr:sensor histidine kinase [Actinomycetota bacterium]
MDAHTVRRRLSQIDPLVLDVAIAVALAALACLQIWFIARARPSFPMPPGGEPRFIRLGDRAPDVLAYLLAASAFLPLAIRRRLPWVALGMSFIGTLAYMFQQAPPAFVTLGPMIAIYTVAAHARPRRSGLFALLIVGLAAAIPLLAFSSSIRWVAEGVGAFVLIAAAAFLGETTRNRRDYIAEVEHRAAEAERTREEEAKRRVDDERIRIARDVHDIVAHSLSIVTVQASAAEALLDNDPARARESIVHVRATGKQALAELRSMLDVLRTGDADAPLAPAADITHIEGLVVPLRDAGLDVDLAVAGDLGGVPAYVSVSAYRIVQEALTNVVRHARASHVCVCATVTASELTLEVVDDGVGSTSARESDPNDNPSHGLRGMAERVSVLGGTLVAGPATEGGFRVLASIPLARSAT